MTRRVLFALLCCTCFFLTTVAAFAQTTESPSPAADDGETASPSSSPEPTEPASEGPLPTPPSSSPAPSESPTAEEEPEATEEEPDGTEEAQAEPCPSEEPSEAASEEPEVQTAAVPEPTPSGGESAEPSDECASPSPSPTPEAITIDQGGGDEGAESDATLADDTMASAAFDASAPAPSRIDAGGGYLARARVAGGVNWLVVAGVLALLALPGARAYRALRR